MKKEQLAELLNAVLMMGNHLRGQSVAGLRAKEGAKALERNVERVSESTQERTKTLQTHFPRKSTIRWAI